MEFQFHDFEHFKHTASVESDARHHNLSDNVQVLLPGATEKQVVRLHEALGKKFNPKSTIGGLKGCRAYRIGRDGSLEYHPPASRTPPSKQPLWYISIHTLMNQLSLPEQTPFLIYGGSSSDVAPHAKNLMSAVDVIRKLKIEAIVYRNDLQGGHHAWHINPPQDPGATRPRTRKPSQ